MTKINLYYAVESEFLFKKGFLNKKKIEELVKYCFSIL